MSLPVNMNRPIKSSEVLQEVFKHAPNSDVSLYLANLYFRLLKEEGDTNRAVQAAAEEVMRVADKITEQS